MERLKSFTEWLEKNWEPDNMFPPSLSADEALNYLKDYLLGENWYVSYPAGKEQIYTEIVYSILELYSKKFKKELKQREKQK